MRNRSKLLAAALAATALLGLAVQSASANRLSINESERGFKAVWTTLNLNAERTLARCPVTLEGTFEVSSLAKRPGTRLGTVTGATAGTCSMRLLRETLPWEITYNSFTGTLPNITGVTLNLIGVAFQIFQLI